jgi:hypothetical protein
VVEALSTMLARANAAGHISGVVPHLIPGGLTHLQYADDTLILIQYEERQLINLKFLLLCFEEMSGLKINYLKSEVIVMNQPRDVQQRVADSLNCKLGAFPFTYLGMPISDRSLTIEQWLFLVLKMAGRIDSWLGRFLSAGGRLILSNSCLASLPMFVMGLFLLQDGIHLKFDSHRARFFWEGAGSKRKYHLLNWTAVCKPKECGGLGIINSKNMNVALMLKWIWRLYHEDEAIWVRVLRAKYASADDIFAGSGVGGSPFWRSLHKIKHLFKLGAAYGVVDGQRTLFWLDLWEGLQPLRDRLPSLFAICEDPMISVAQACGDPGGVRFRRSFDAELRREWLELRAVIDSTQLGVGPDVVRWTLDPSGVFTVKSMYSKLSQGATIAHFKDVWEAKLPLKVKIFTWQLVINRLPTRSLIAARHGPSTGRCALCVAIEDVNHIFFTCSLAKFMWSVVRQLFDCAWSPANFPQFYAIVANQLGGQLIRLKRIYNF